MGGSEVVLLKATKIRKLSLSEIHGGKLLSCSNQRLRYVFLYLHPNFYLSIRSSICGNLYHDNRPWQDRKIFNEFVDLFSVLRVTFFSRVAI